MKKESFEGSFGVVAKARNGIFVVCYLRRASGWDAVDELFLKTVF